jgi:PadR family transcriptional regulator, regulatory protein PadR
MRNNFTYIYVINENMKGTNLGEFEEIVLLTIAALVTDAYSVAICDELERNLGRPAKLGVVHAVLNRLEDKGLSVLRTRDSLRANWGKRQAPVAVSEKDFIP